MKKILLLWMLPFLCNALTAQNPEGAAKLVDEGIVLNDKGDFNGAIAKYQQALELDKDNVFGLAETAYTLQSMGKNDEAIEYCQKAIQKHRGEKSLKTVYITYGNALDAEKKPEGSVRIYDEGIAMFPDFFLLHFNKGITLSGMGKADEAFNCFKKSISLNPAHPGSHNALARMINVQKARIPALLAYWTFLVIEPEGQRAKENSEKMLTLMDANVDKTGKNEITIKISGDGELLKEDNFSPIDMTLSMMTALDEDKKNKKKTMPEKFVGKVSLVCSSLAGAKKDEGFFWKHYAPFFIEMGEKKMTETFAYIALLSTGDKDVIKWFKTHDEEVRDFYKWVEGYEWASE